MSDEVKKRKSKWLSGRKVFTVMAFSASLYLKMTNHLGDDAFTWITLGLAAGHHLPEILKQWRGGKDVVSSS